MKGIYSEDMAMEDAESLYRHHRFVRPELYHLGYKAITSDDSIFEKQIHIEGGAEFAIAVVETEKNIENQLKSELGADFAQIHDIELQDAIENPEIAALKAIENELKKEDA